MNAAPRVLPVGDAALSVDFGDRLDPALAERVRALDASLDEHPLPGAIERVPTCRALLVLYEPTRVVFAELADELLRRVGQARRAPPPGRTHVLPVRYGGDDGPDLESVARARGLRPDDVVELHAGRAYEALMLGFLPGFAYLGLLAPELELPRRATPRARVARGSVAVAGRQTGVYPCDSPGGWHLLGRTSARLFDPASAPPARLRVGDRVRFAPCERLDAVAPVAWQPAPGGVPALEVLDPGWHASVQDDGRHGLRRHGVGAAGALDLHALARARLALGETQDAAALEVALGGLRLRFLQPATFAVCGADLGALLERADMRRPWPVPRGVAVRARPGNVLTFEGRRAGCRAYVAFAGGLDVPLVLGARATDLTAGFGGFAGRALRAGDRLALGAARAGVCQQRAGDEPDPASEVTLRVVLGPQDDHFDAPTQARFFGTAWRVSATSDRVGCRLQGPRLSHAGPAEIVSDGLVPGCVQVPPDGQPIVSLADGPTTGGYPKLATVVRADLPQLAQLVPGESRVRFVPR